MYTVECADTCVQDSKSGTLCISSIESTIKNGTLYRQCKTCSSCSLDLMSFAALRNCANTLTQIYCKVNVAFIFKSILVFSCPLPLELERMRGFLLEKTFFKNLEFGFLFNFI